MGHGYVKTTFPWCPLWFMSRWLGYEWGSDATVDGIPPFVFVEKIWVFWKSGQLHQIVEPPWTPGFIDLIRVAEELNKVDEQQAAEKHRRDFGDLVEGLKARR